MNEPKEQTSDWIVYPPVSEGKIYKRDECAHGIYRLLEPRTLVCAICGVVIVSPKEVEEFGDWVNDLCRGA